MDQNVGEIIPARVKAEHRIFQRVREGHERAVVTLFIEKRGAENLGRVGQAADVCVVDNRDIVVESFERIRDEKRIRRERGDNDKQNKQDGGVEGACRHQRAKTAGLSLNSPARRERDILP